MIDAYLQIGDIKAESQDDSTTGGWDSAANKVCA